MKKRFSKEKISFALQQAETGVPDAVPSLLEKFWTGGGNWADRLREMADQIDDQGALRILASLKTVS